MAKFIVQNFFNIEENNEENDNELSILEEEEDNQIIINNKVKSFFKIGKHTLDEQTLTRASIVKLTILKYSIKEIAKLLKISHSLAWKWAHYENNESICKRKTRINEEKGNIYLKRLRVKLLELIHPLQGIYKKNFLKNSKKK